MLTAIGLIELNSIAIGYEAADAMVKAAQVELLACRSMCPGKFIALVGGDVAAVQSAVKAGVACGERFIVDEFILPNVHPAVIPALSSATAQTEIKALGVIETFSMASIIIAADTAAKAAEVDLVEIRMGLAIGGKAFVTLTGDVGAVKAAIAAGSATAEAKGLLVSKTVIPSPSALLVPHLL